LIVYSENADIKNPIQKSKKFVFQIYPENIDYIESLSHEEKQYIINYLIQLHRDNQLHNYKIEKEGRTLKKIIFIIVCILIGVPLLFFLIGISLDLTRSSYYSMQKNFEKLIQK